ncbi:MAG: phosphomannomutase [Sphingomonadales bacterium]|nr:phosphomannomutase [Sphingomonadales bacterium]
MAQSGVEFGTSGARGRVVDMTDRICFGYTAGFLCYLARVDAFAPGGRVALAGDLRPSTPRILAACVAAIREMGAEPVFCGYVPTPALALHALDQHIPAIMVTGSHIPDDRNGIKFYRPDGEVLKEDEDGMRSQAVPLPEDAFDDAGMLVAPPALPPVTDAVESYVARYRLAFGGALQGKRIGVYQHSAVGRDILARIVSELGAEVVPLGRSEKFIPVDTEAIRPEDVELARQWAAEQHFDAIISTDGDSDRPLLADHTGEWLRGDVLGVLCAQALGAGQVVTPVSSNTVLECSGAFAATTRTRIGSPYVIAAMNAALAAGSDRVCGYEANGGFLLASTFPAVAGTLSPLPTRDAVLPIIATLAAAGQAPLADLVAALPPRVTYSDRIKEFPQALSTGLFDWLLAGNDAARLARLDTCFGGVDGAIVTLDLTDGIRMTTAAGTVIHLRRSGNAPELRCYSEADNRDAAEAINRAALAVVRDRLVPALEAGDGAGPK